MGCVLDQSPVYSHLCMNCEGLREANRPAVVSMMSLLVQMMTTAIYGVPVAAAALADEKGNAVVVQQIASIHSLEHMLRPVRPLALPCPYNR